MARVLNIFTIAVIIFMPSTLMPRQAASIEWQLDNTLSIEDREAILALSKQMGIEQPRRISILQIQPSVTICRFVRVESSVIEEGNHRSWFEISLRPPESSECLRPPRGAPVIGRWTTLSSHVEKHEEWRIRDNQWHIDVSLGAEVPYSEAELIVLAIRRGKFLNRVRSNGSLNSNFNPAKVSADTIIAIQRDSTGTRTYEVRTGQGSNGFMLYVKILGKRVELYSYGSWEVER
jgi:hypothetical protein